MMAENTNWCLNGSSSTSSTASHLHKHGYPVTWTQLLVGRLATDQEERFNSTSCDGYPDYRRKQLDHNSSINDEAQMTSHGPRNFSNRGAFDDHHLKHEMKEQIINQQQQELYSTHNSANHKDHDHPWSSCFTGENNHINNLDFSRNRKRNQHQVHDQYYTSLQCNDTSTLSGTFKKSRVQPSSTQQPALKMQVRKEKLGDRISALHQLVSPFGKTDTASVLLEAMGYIRFLEGQIQALSCAYLGNALTGGMSIQQSVNVSIQQSVNEQLASSKDLSSIGLSLVPVDYAHHINNTIGIDNNSINNGADYWAPSSI